MKKSYLLMLPLLALAAPAQAQDLSGFRVEAIGAVDWMDQDFGQDSDQFNPIREGDVGATFGAAVGYDFVLGAGLRAGVDLEITQTTADTPIIVSDTRVGEVRYGNDFYVGGRVTVPLGQFSLVGKLGYTTLEREFVITTASLANNYSDDNVDGVRGALGFHYTGDDDDRVYYGLEYRYSDYQGDLTRQQVALVVGTRF